jgi:hypothetical protein
MKLRINITSNKKYNYILHKNISNLKLLNHAKDENNLTIVVHI